MVAGEAAPGLLKSKDAANSLGNPLYILSVSLRDSPEEDGHRGLEGACLRNRRGNNDRKVEGEAKPSERDDDERDLAAEVPEVSSQRVPEQEERSLHDEWRALHDKVKSPGYHPPHLELSVTITIDDGSIRVRVEPLLPESSKEGCQ